MRSPFMTTVAQAVALGIMVSTAPAQNIECQHIGTAYDELFADSIKRINAVKAEAQGLPANTPPQRREDVRRKFCTVAGELLGLYKFVGALANDCSRQGSNNTELRATIEKQRGLTEQAIKDACQ